LFNDIYQAPLDIETDRIMMCGSPGMLEELRQLFETRGFLEGSHNEPGHFVIERRSWSGKSRVPDAVQRFFSGAPQSRDPLVVKQDGPRISSAIARRRRA